MDTSGAHAEFVAAPKGAGPFPAVVVLHEAFGLNDDMRRIARRFAAEGYVAAAPDLYAHGAKAICMARMLARGPDSGAGARAMADIDACAARLEARPDVDAERLAVIGFCMGGGFALACATKGRVKAAAVSYGAVPKERSALEGVCPVVAQYGALDRSFAKQALRLVEHLSALGVAHDVKVYEGVGHSFMSYDNAPAWLLKLPSPMHVGYDEAAAEDAWARILAFFAEHLAVVS